eukprot:gnl/MRDRNA2_/MRDRNA2_85159_c0_seq1.p1 gnl/MRDRNA2_/MRDRNA2_85159_c0~~gnl/MRDRNA2_/MRDRNA2_85159_c0_seq1.p1  ORF type:complete len:118 (-),score=20.94 gnl/MRDRNA2_/MRDRNA2_85159_c0_seq1:131-484(-)
MCSSTGNRFQMPHAATCVCKKAQPVMSTLASESLIHARGCQSSCCDNRLDARRIRNKESDCKKDMIIGHGRSKFPQSAVLEANQDHQKLGSHECFKNTALYLIECLPLLILISCKFL